AVVVVGEGAQLLRPEVDHVEVGEPGGGEALEDDALASRIPRGRLDADQVGPLVASDDLTALEIPEEECVALEILRAEREDAVRVDIDAGLVRVERLELRAALALDDR